MPQSSPILIGWLGQVAAQLRGEPGDQHRILVIGLVERQVFGPPRPGAHQRLHAHKRHAALGGQLSHHPPPVTGRLHHDRHPGEPRRCGTRGSPVQRHPQFPGPPPERPPRQHPRLMIGDHDHLLTVSQIDAGDCIAQRHRFTQPGQPGVAVAITPGNTATVRHGRPPPARGIPSPNSASGGHLHIPNRHAKRLTMPNRGRRAPAYLCAGWHVHSRSWSSSCSGASARLRFRARSQGVWCAKLCTWARWLRFPARRPGWRRAGSPVSKPAGASGYWSAGELT